VVGNRSDLGGQREDHVEIADRQQIGLAGRKPILRRRTLTFWAMAVATRVVGDALWPQSSHRSTWPPSTAERHCSIADITWS